MNKERKIPSTVLMTLILAAVAAAGFADTLQETVSGSRGAAVLIRARTYEPGNILLLTLVESAPVREVKVEFLKRDYLLKPKDKGGEPLALIGLDLGLKPGRYTLELTLIYKNNGMDAVRKDIVVLPRKFPFKRLILAQKYVTPPPQELARIQEEAKLVSEVYAKTAARWLGDGFFVLPHEAQMMFNFGERRILNGQTSSVHSGVDIEATLGSDVTASNTGRVALAADLYFSGNTVILDHGLGVFTSYFHMSKLEVRTGDMVRKGDKIGEVGSTGRSTGPHLHWAVRIFDSRVDPRALLRLPLD